MPRFRGEPLTTIRIEGTLFSSDVLRQIADGKNRIPGLPPDSNHLSGTERLDEAAGRSWNRLRRQYS